MLSAMFILYWNRRKSKRVLGLTFNLKLDNIEDLVAYNKIVTICLLLLLVQSLESLLVAELFVFGHIEYR